MLEDISGMMVDRLLRKEVIQYDDIEVYMYGIIQLLRYVCNIVPMIIIGAVLGEWWQGMLFVIALAALRAYAGGYHASTSRCCFFLSIGVFTVALLVMKYLTISNFVCWGLSGLSGVSILYLSPVEAVNKPLDSIEKKLYRKKSIVIWLVEMIAIALFMILGMKEAAMCVILAHVVVGCSLIVGSLDVMSMYKARG